MKISSSFLLSYLDSGDAAPHHRLKGTQCTGEFREMKMQPSLERALKHKEILGVWVTVNRH